MSHIVFVDYKLMINFVLLDVVRVTTNLLVDTFFLHFVVNLFLLSNVCFDDIHKLILIVSQNIQKLVFNWNLKSPEKTSNFNGIKQFRPSSSTRFFSMTKQ